MPKTPENIFSWRAHIRKLPHDERVQWFYEKKLVPKLSDDVMVAEIARQKAEHVRVEKIFDRWTSRDPYTHNLLVQDKAHQRLEQLPQKSKSESDTTWFSQVAIGLAGLARVRQVDLNSSIPEKFTQEDVERVRTVHTRVLDLYRQVEIDHLPPRTIHGGAIHWRGEATQDQARMFEKLGSRDGVAQTLIEGLMELSRNLREIEPYINVNTLRSAPVKTELQEKYIGTAYAISVSAARLARVVGKRELMIEAVRRLTEVFPAQPNVHRLTTISAWSMKLAVEPTKGLEPLKRLILFVVGIVGIIDAVRINKQEAFRALKSELKRWK